MASETRSEILAGSVGPYRVITKPDFNQATPPPEIEGSDNELSAAPALSR